VSLSIANNRSSRSSSGLIRVKTPLDGLAFAGAGGVGLGAPGSTPPSPYLALPEGVHLGCVVSRLRGLFFAFSVGPEPGRPRRVTLTDFPRVIRANAKRASLRGRSRWTTRANRLRLREDLNDSMYHGSALYFARRHDRRLSAHRTSFCPAA